MGLAVKNSISPKWRLSSILKTGNLAAVIWHFSIAHTAGTFPGGTVFRSTLAFKPPTAGWVNEGTFLLAPIKRR